LERKIKAANVGLDNRLIEVSSAGTNLEQLFRDFYATEAPTVTSPKELANRLADVTHFIRDQIIAALSSGDHDMQKSLDGRYKAFKELLLPALKTNEFADLYAQAMTYGLFAAKLSAPEETRFTLAGAYQFLFGNKFLRRLFSDVSEELDEIDIIRPYLQDIVSLLNRADFASILADFGKRTRTEDPVVHFYETFLAAYDPKLRESRGVYYTPEPVVQFIVRSVDNVLKTRFDKPWGLADPSVKVLDPATGTGTFLYYVIQKVHDEMIERAQAGSWPEKSKELINRIFGFELLIAPYVVSHLKLGLELKNLGAPLEGRDERLRVYLTNSLEEGVVKADQFAQMGSYIAEESNDATSIKNQKDIMVVLGNPPYSGHSVNPSKDKKGNLNFIGKLIRDYYFLDGAPLGERNPKWLQDDYVKFIRYGEWRINQTGHGVLAYITNHGYLDNPTFRGMRQHLLRTFDEIFVLNLHGNSKKKEETPDGATDENVFDIQQGVAILLAIKKIIHDDNYAEKTGAIVHHASFWGLREVKYKALSENSLSNIRWRTFRPSKPFYLFTPHSEDIKAEYDIYSSLIKVFPLTNIGMNTHRDDFVIDFDLQVLKQRILEFRSERIADIEIRNKYGLEDNRDWKLAKARRNLRQDINWKNHFVRCIYRPFDFRWLFYSQDVVDYPRPIINQHIIGEKNLTLATTRQTREPFSVIATDLVCGQHKIATRYDGSNLFPLYTYSKSRTSKLPLLEKEEKTRLPNLSTEFINEFSTKLGLEFVHDELGDLVDTFGPEDVFSYAYAIFHSPTYRTRYAEFLKIDFPRLPLTSDKALFASLVALGKQLVDFHLLKTPKVDEFITSYPTTGTNLVEKVAFSAGNVWINPTQYFGGVPEEVWNFKVGGYQVCDKWLKDRKGRVLSGEEIHHYQRVVVALHETIRLMKEVDEVIPGWPIE
jgi:predicted helicase